MHLPLNMIEILVAGVRKIKRKQNQVIRLKFEKDFSKSSRLEKELAVVFSGSKATGLSNFKR